MKVSIIILNYNTSRLTLNCINSIRKYLPNDIYEIIVVDNTSQETDYQYLTKNLSGQGITIIRNKINCGFGVFPLQTLVYTAHHNLRQRAVSINAS